MALGMYIRAPVSGEDNQWSWFLNELNVHDVHKPYTYLTSSYLSICSSVHVFQSNCCTDAVTWYERCS